MALLDDLAAYEQAKKVLEEKRDAIINSLKKNKTSFIIPEFIGLKYSYIITALCYVGSIHKHVKIKLEGFYVDDNNEIRVCGHLCRGDDNFEGAYVTDAECYDYHAIVTFVQAYTENRLSMRIPRLAALVLCDRAMTERVQDAILNCGANIYEEDFPRLLRWADKYEEK